MIPTLSQYTHYDGITARGIRKRVVIEADLQLQTPTHFGNGDADELTDMPLLVDSYDGKSPLLTGASIAGTLRAYLMDCIGNNYYVTKLFGPEREQDTDMPQSCLIIDDALGSNYGSEVRDGVGVDPETRMAADKKLYSQAFWQAGTMFKLRFELLIHAGDNEQELLMVLATALDGLQNGSITLGGRKSRGLGRVTVKKWRRADFDLTTTGDLIAWLQLGDQSLDGIEGRVKEGTTLAEACLEPQPWQATNSFTIDALFQLHSSLLIRTGGSNVNAPDMVHLSGRFRHSDKPMEQRPLLAGTSLAGVLRARAGKIVNTLAGKNRRTRAFINGIFGCAEEKESGKKLGSRLRVEEHAIENGKIGLIQNRVSIDRFTGGAKDGALFNQQPVFARPETRLRIKLRLMPQQRDLPQDEKQRQIREDKKQKQIQAEIGLLMLLIKDLWTGDLPIGGESSVGRGRLLGHSATLSFAQADGNPLQWTITETQGSLAIEGDADALESTVSALSDYLNGERP